jgi:predicted amidophosphoribosyltransferase
MQVLDHVHDCIYCGKPLSKWERTRSYCWDCNELTTSEAYDDEDCYENDDNDNWYDIAF